MFLLEGCIILSFFSSKHKPLIPTFLTKRYIQITWRTSNLNCSNIYVPHRPSRNARSLDQRWSRIGFPKSRDFAFWRMPTLRCFKMGICCPSRFHSYGVTGDAEVVQIPRASHETWPDPWSVSHKAVSLLVPNRYRNRFDLYWFRIDQVGMIPIYTGPKRTLVSQVWGIKEEGYLEWGPMAQSRYVDISYLVLFIL